MSKSHDFYTTQIVRYIEKFYYTSGIDIADDTQDVKTGCRPNQINAIIDAEPRSCLPDLTAKDISTEPNLYIVGEAKTAERKKYIMNESKTRRKKNRQSKTN